MFIITWYTECYMHWVDVKEIIVEVIFKKIHFPEVFMVA